MCALTLNKSTQSSVILWFLHYIISNHKIPIKKGVSLLVVDKLFDVAGVRSSYMQDNVVLKLLA